MLCVREILLVFYKIEILNGTQINSLKSIFVIFFNSVRVFFESRHVLIVIFITYICLLLYAKTLIFHCVIFFSFLQKTDFLKNRKTYLREIFKRTLHLL